MCTRKYRPTVRRGLRVALVVSAGFLLSSCTAARLAMRHGKLETKIEVTQSIFLEPVSGGPATVFVSETSTVGPRISITSTLTECLLNAGYTVVDRPEDAAYVIQINHLSLVAVELSGDQTLEDALNSASTVATVAGSAAIIAGSKDMDEVAGVALAAGLISFAVDAATKYTAHTLTTDVRVREVLSYSDGTEEILYHETTVISGAAKVNLRVEEALPVLIQGVSRSLPELLPPVAESTVS